MSANIWSAHFKGGIWDCKLTLSLEVICLVLFSPILGFPGDSVAKSPPALQEVQVQFLHQENPVEKERVTHSSMLA